jgi:hypothetical protein
MKNSEHNRDAAESSFKKKERRITEGRKAMAEHDAAARLVDANTARLRALRLARDEAERLNPPPPVKASPGKKKKKIAAASPAIAAAIEPEGDKQPSPQTLSDHLEMAERDGAREPTTRTKPERIATSVKERSGG